MFFFVTVPLDAALDALGGIAAIILWGIFALVLLGFGDQHPEAANVGLALFGLLFVGLFVRGAIVRYRTWRRPQGPGPGALRGVLFAVRPILLVTAWFLSIGAGSRMISLVAAHDPAAARGLFVPLMLAPNLLLVSYGCWRWWHRRVQRRALSWRTEP